MAERLLSRTDLDLTPSAPVALPAAPAGAPLPVASQEDLHELRVRIPVDLHRQLLSLKVLRGRSLAETVSLALDIYFAEHTAERDAEQAEQTAPTPSNT